jgi:methylmalonyl-CoA mutase
LRKLPLEKQASRNSGQDITVGVKQHRLEKKIPYIFDVDNDMVRKQQIKRLEQIIKASR